MISAIFAAAVLLAEVTPAASDAATAQAPAAAPASAPAAAPATKVKGANKDGMICHTDPNLGTRLPKKICVRAADAEQQRLEDRAALERSQSQVRIPGN